MKIYNILLCIYLLLKPYYFFKSGGMQIGDIILGISFLLFLMKKRKNGEIKRIISENKKLLLFIILTFLINSLYYAFYQNFMFILSSIYYVYNLFIVIMFTSFLKESQNIKILDKIVKINLLIQLLLFIGGVGRYYLSTRYMGTFNDPNQFAYYIFTSYLLLYLININKKNGNILYLIISILLIIVSSSTAMTLGIGVFFILEFMDIIIKLPFLLKRNFIKIFIFIIISTLLICIFALFTDDDVYMNIKSKVMNITIISRIEDKLSRVDYSNNETNMTIWEERGYDKIYNQPYVILYGSGEGEYGRFKAVHDGEIHATIPSILFYYGIVPTLILLSWLWQYVKKQNINVLIVYISLFLESFFLLNQRQAYFWILIVLGKVVKEKIANKEE